MNIIIFGDKFQKRMKSRGCVGLYKSKNNYLIVHQYLTIKKIFPNAKIIYIYGFEHKRLMSVIDQHMELKNNITFIYNEKYHNTNYGTSLKLAKDYLDNDTILTFGDISLDEKLLLSFKLNKDISKLIVTNNKTNKLGCIIGDSRIQNIFYDLDNTIEEIYYISQKDIKTMLDIVSNHTPSIKNMFVFEIINLMIDRNINFKPVTYSYRNKKIRTNHAT